MAENRLLRAWGQGCARSLGLRLIIGIVVLGGFSCLGLFAILIPIDQDYKIFVWAGLVLIFILVIIGGVVLWGVSMVRKRAADFDEAFRPFGLKGRHYLTNGRQYHGIYRGYPMHVYFSRGPTLQIYLDVPLKTRVGIGRKGALARIAADMVKKESLQITDPTFDHLVVYPDDHAWAADLLADQQARAAIIRLTSEETATELRSLSITPNALLLQFRYLPTQQITPENVRQWITDLYELSQIAHGIRPPTVIAEETKLERTTREDRGTITRWTVIITGSVFTVLTVCILAITALIIYIEEAGI
jgi:uncharacterized membrane protein YqjE